MTHETIGDLIAARFGLPAGAGRQLPAQGVVAELLRHRVCRAYAAQPVREDIMQVLLAAALSAPSKSDLQQASIVRVLDRDLRGQVDTLLGAMPWIADAPQFLLVCGDNRRARRIAALRGKPYPNDTLDMFMSAAVDAGIVLQNFVVAAESLGLGCCPISVVRDHAQALTRLLGLPAAVFPVAGLVIGYPAREGALSMRLPPAVTVHVDGYDDSDFEAQLAAYDARREAARPTPPGAQREVARFGIAAPYSWSEDKARQYASPQRAGFGEFVRGQGFTLT